MDTKADTQTLMITLPALSSLQLIKHTSHNLAPLDCGLAARRKPRLWPNKLTIRLLDIDCELDAVRGKQDRMLWIRDSTKNPSVSSLILPLQTGKPLNTAFSYYWYLQAMCEN